MVVAITAGAIAAPEMQRGARQLWVNRVTLTTRRELRLFYDADIADRVRQVRKVPILLKMSKIEELRKSRKSRMFAISTTVGALKNWYERQRAFALIDVVPHIAARETHGRS